MDDFKLISQPPLAQVDIDVNGLRLTSCSDISVVSAALPLGEEEVAAAALKSAYKVELPDNRHSVVSPAGIRVVRTAIDQILIIFPEYRHSTERHVDKAMQGTVYTTDQSDVWTALKLEGFQAATVLERICPLDLHTGDFPVDAAARTAMEHLGVMIIRTAENAFMLISASSSAGSFLHMIETSMQNVSSQP